MKTIKEIIKNNKALYYLVKKERKFEYVILPYLKFSFKRKLRKENIFINKNVKKIKDLINTGVGKRCFIIANGPSLKIEDIRKLKNEITFGMNSICKLDKKENWQPSYFGIQDLYVYKKMQKDIKEYDENTTVFISNNFPFRYKLRGSNIIELPICVKDHMYNPNAKKIDFSEDCYDVVYDGYTITYTLLQIAIYMKFDEIYLIGADCNYQKKGPKHFIETGVEDPNLDYATERMQRAYRVAKTYADKKNIKIFNATRGGCLEVFPRISFDEISFENEREY